MPIEVQFSCRAGDGWSRWSSVEAPRVGTTYDAELDTDESLELGRNATDCNTHDIGIRIGTNNVTLSGTIESRDEDGMLYLRLASDCLLMIETEDTISTGQHVQFSVPAAALELTPFGS